MATKITLEEAMGITTADLANLTTPQLKKYTTKLASAANRRKKALEASEYGVHSPAYAKIKNRAAFSSVDKNRNQLVNEMLEAQNFLHMKTSTVSGFNALRKKRAEIMGGTFGSEEEEKAFWEVYRRVEEQNPDIIGHQGSEQIQRSLYKSMVEGESTSLLAEVTRLNLEANYPEGYDPQEVLEGYTVEELAEGGYFVNEFGETVNFGYTQEDYIGIMNELARIGYEKKQAVLNEEFRTIAERNKGKART